MPLQLRLYSDLSQHIKEPQNCIYCLHFLKNLKIWKRRHASRNLLCIVCRSIVSFLFGIFHRMRTQCVAWECYGSSDIATVTKGTRSLQRVNSDLRKLQRIVWTAENHWYTSSYTKKKYTHPECAIGLEKSLWTPHIQSTSSLNGCLLVGATEHWASGQPGKFLSSGHLPHEQLNAPLCNKNMQ